MASAEEVEVKIRVDDAEKLSAALASAGFHLATPRTHEFNTLFDYPDLSLRARGEVLRLRLYGEKWTLTHKSKGSVGRHKSRMERETRVNDGETVAAIFAALGLQPSFRYEKYRAEWSDGAGHVVIDETPIGTIAELEGPAEWIDRTAERLGIAQSEYITQSYAQLFYQWRERSRSNAAEMTWEAISPGAPRPR
jgi:adenylate cyclase class 2